MKPTCMLSGNQLFGLGDPFVLAFAQDLIERDETGLRVQRIPDDGIGFHADPRADEAADYLVVRLVVHYISRLGRGRVMAKVQRAVHDRGEEEESLLHVDRQSFGRPGDEAERQSLVGRGKQAGMVGGQKLHEF